MNEERTVKSEKDALAPPESHSSAARSTSEVLQAQLNADQLEALFADYRGSTRVLSVRSKSPGERRAGDEPWTIDDALHSLRSAAPASFQIRYEFEGAVWSDTLSPTAAGARLIRCRLPEI